MKHNDYTPPLITANPITIEYVQAALADFALPDGAVTEAKLANLAVTAAKLATSAVTNTKVAADAAIDASKINLTQPAWTAPTLATDWGNYGSGYATAGYYKDSLGIVRLRGLLTYTGAEAASTAFVLPLGYRPEFSGVYPVHVFNGTTFVLGRVDVMSSGSIIKQTPTGSLNPSGYVSIEGITFRAV